METSCPNCQRQLRPGMNFCPGCGSPTGASIGTGQGRGQVPVSGSEGTLHFHAPTQGPYPMPYFPAPAMYPPPMSGKRAGAIASAVIMIISAVFVLIVGIYYTIEGLWWDDFWVVLGIICFITFSMAIVGTIAVVRRAWRLTPLLADTMLIACGAFSIFDLGVLGPIILILAIIALILLVVSWGQFNEPRAMQYPLPYMSPPPGTPMPVAGMGMGMTPPPAVGAPPPGPMSPTWGAPPPGPMSPTGGAPPPRPVVVEEEDAPVIAYVGER